MTVLQRLVTGLGLAPAMAALAFAGAATASTPVHKCPSADLRNSFTAGGPKSFGVFRLRIAGGRCPIAHKVAKDWMSRFNASVRAGHLRLPKSVDGFSFTNLPAHTAQTFSERGRRRTVTLWFDYVVPNG